MTVIGMFHYRRYPQKVFKAYTFAAAAKAEGAKFYYFTPRQVNIEKGIFHGWVYKKGKWTEKRVRPPDVVYNAGSPITEYGEEVYDWLYERVPFTSHAIGDKYTVYNQLKKAKEFAQYLIPSAVIQDVSAVLTRLHKYRQVVIKPLSGHKGMGILYLEQKPGEYLGLQGDRAFTYTRDELDQLLAERYLNGEFLIQPYISSKTRAGLPFDFRLHVQKNGEGKWVVVAVYPRISHSPQKIVTNLSNGGYTTTLNSFLTQEFQGDAFNIKRYLEQFALAFARHMDQLYNNSLDELGIDVGLDGQRKLWLYEVNWRPGVPPTFNYEIDVARNTIRYALYLAQKQKRKKSP